MTSSLNRFGLIGFVLLIASGAIYFLVRPDKPTLYINEFMANNSSCCNSIAKADELSDWIEIFNGGDVAVDIGGMYFSQKKLRKEAFQIPKNNPALTTIKPGGFLLVWADGDPGRGALHVGFKLDQHGEHIGLSDGDGRTIDTITFEGQKKNVSLGRTRDGGKSWKEFVVPTPGKTNE